MRKNKLLTIVIITILTVTFFFLQGWLLSYFELYYNNLVFYPTFILLFLLMYSLSKRISIKNIFMKTLFLFSFLLICHSLSDVLLVWFYGGTLAEKYMFFAFMHKSWIPIILISSIPIWKQEYKGSNKPQDDIIDDDFINKRF